jgi:hypothetical protein
VFGLFAERIFGPYARDPKISARSGHYPLSSSPNDVRETARGGPVAYVGSRVRLAPSRPFGRPSEVPPSSERPACVNPKQGSRWSFGPIVAPPTEGSVPRFGSLGAIPGQDAQVEPRQRASGNHLRTSIYGREATRLYTFVSHDLLVAQNGPNGVLTCEM